MSDFLVGREISDLDNISNQDYDSCIGLNEVYKMPRPAKRKQLIEIVASHIAKTDTLHSIGIQEAMEYLLKIGRIESLTYNWQMISDKAFDRLECEIRQRAIARNRLTVNGYGREYKIIETYNPQTKETIPEGKVWFLGNTETEGIFKFRHEHGQIVYATNRELK